MDFHFETDKDVVNAIEKAASEACQVLDSIFPGFDKNGITSEFQGHLKEILTEMLKGQAPVIRGCSTSLPTLIVDETFFGNPNQKGNAFLVTKLSDPVWEKDESTGRFQPQRHLVALDLDSGFFRPLSQISDAWTSFELAASSAVEHLKKHGLSMEEARAEGLSIKAVTMISEGGYSVTNNIQMVS